MLWHFPPKMLHSLTFCAFVLRFGVWSWWRSRTLWTIFLSIFINRTLPRIFGGSIIRRLRRIWERRFCIITSQRQSGSLWNLGDRIPFQDPIQRTPNRMDIIIERDVRIGIYRWILIHFVIGFLGENLLNSSSVHLISSAISHFIYFIASDGVRKRVCEMNVWVRVNEWNLALFWCLVFWWSLSLFFVFSPPLFVAVHLNEDVMRSEEWPSFLRSTASTFCSVLVSSNESQCIFSCFLSKSHRFPAATKWKS